MDKSIEKGFEGEAFVHEIAVGSFLSYWCYPNPKDEEGDKKELCDLLIFFNGKLVLFCVKNYQFKGDYSKYFRQTIDSDLKQLQGAQRKLTQLDRDIVIKNVDGRREVIKRSSISKIIRIVVHLGEGVHFYPFNRLTKKEEYVHVLDKKSFKGVLQYLDTISDFTEYLEKREEAFSNKTVIILPGEENSFDKQTSEHFFDTVSARDEKSRQVILSGTELDIMSSYLMNKRNFPKELFDDTFTDFYWQADGDWDDFLKNEQTKNKAIADQESYFIDELVKNELLPRANEGIIELAKCLLSFDRLGRRVIGNSLGEFIRANNHRNDRTIARRHAIFNKTAIIFVFYSQAMPEDQVDMLLPIVMDTYAVYSKYSFSEVVLIATTNNCAQFKFGFEKDIAPFPKDREDLALADMKTLGWFTDMTFFSGTTVEFPNSTKMSTEIKFFDIF